MAVCRSSLREAPARPPSSRTSRTPSSVVLPSHSPSARTSEPPRSAAHRMTRRNFIALISLCVVIALGAIVVGVGVFATQSHYGQETMRKWVQARVSSSIHGRAYIGRVSGNFLTGITIDSLELRDDEDSLFVASGRITLRYDPRDLVDRRLYFRGV